MAQLRPSAFAPLDWSLAVLTLLGAGSAFFFTKLVLPDMPFEVVAWLRILLGALTLAFIPAARKPLVHRRDWLHVAVLGATWMAIPFLLNSKAQESIDSALAGMLAGSVPVFTAAIALVFYRDRLNLLLLIGLILGFVGVIVISAPEFTGRYETIGILLAVVSACFFALSYNLAAPLQGRNSALSVIWRAQLVAAVLTAPTGLLALPQASPTATSITAMLILGIFSTGLAFATASMLVGRVGSTRASIYIYLVPVVAIVLGTLSGESVHPISLVGIGLVLIGAFLATRASREAATTTQNVQDDTQ